LQYFFPEKVEIAEDELVEEGPALCHEAVHEKDLWRR
jgi:hypothetical protein